MSSGVVFALAACAGSASVLMARHLLGIDLNLRWYRWRFEYWSARVDHWREALQDAIDEGEQEAELMIEAELTRAMRRQTYWRELIEVRRRG